MTQPIKHSLLATGAYCTEEILYACLMPQVLDGYKLKTRQQSNVRVDYGNDAKTLVSQSGSGVYVVESVFYVSTTTQERQGVRVDVYTNGGSTPIVVSCTSLTASLTKPESDEYEECLYVPIVSVDSLVIKVRPWFYGGRAYVTWKRYAE